MANMSSDVNPELEREQKIKNKNLNISAYMDFRRLGGFLVISNTIVSCM